ncbi:hypothetical protein ABT332_06300 [Saccharomonospora azurea]|uniref:hypothetical protein n=1 Tax=Saccharomonospora azurea TaxID=40988 RepID=UPI003318F920
MSTTKRVSPAVLHPLKEALRLTYWYKDDLRAFLNASLGDRSLVASLDWTAYKRHIVAQLVDTLAADQHKYFDTLLRLILATSGIEDPSHLKRLTDGKEKYDSAVEALSTLRRQVEPYRKMRTEVEEANRRRELQIAHTQNELAMKEKLSKLQGLFSSIIRQDRQKRGYSIEKFLQQLFELYDIDTKGSFKIFGEQIDGAFTFEGSEYLLEVKWREQPTPLHELDSFGNKISRKLDNTLGLFLSMSGFQSSAIDMAIRGNRPTILLMDGSDLALTLEDRISFPELIRRKKQHAARTGEILLRAADILSN